MEGQKRIITITAPSKTQVLEDAAELSFGNDAEDEENRSSNQTWNLFNKRNMVILGIIAAIVFLCVVTGISSLVLTDNNNTNTMVVESTFNDAPGAAKASKEPKAKASKAPACIPNGEKGELGPLVGPNPEDCDKCCDVCREGEAKCFNDCVGYYCRCV